MRLFDISPTFRSLLAVPFLAAMLAFPAGAETNPNASTPPAEAQSAAPEAQPATGEGAAAEQNGSPESPADPSAAETVPDASKSSILVNVDKSSQEMTIFVDGVEKYSWPVSTGQPGYSTPSGTYTASSMNKIWYSKQWDNAPMPHAVFFTKQGHAIHGTMDEKNLGKPASHGCVRLSKANAATLYALVEENGLENTQVVLTGTTPGGEGPKVASPGKQPREYGYGYAYPPWFGGGQYQYQQQPQKRRGLFGRRWFQQQPQQGYYGPRGNYYVAPRGY